MITPLDHVALIPMRGRDVQFETKKTSRRQKSEKEFETPLLPFEKDAIKKKTARPKSEAKATLSGSLIDRQPKNAEGVYAIRFKDSTWKSTSTNCRDQPPTRDYVQGLLTNYTKNLDLVDGYQGVDLASQMQSVNDLMLEELINELRVVNLGQAKLLELFRQSTAKVFNLLYEDAAISRKENIRLKTETQQAIADKNNAITQCNIRIQNSEEEAARKIAEKERKLQTKMAEYDNDMKNFLEQKSKLEDHVKALHHVFLDFQQDAVYLKLEELKQEVQKNQQKLTEKDEDIVRLQIAIQKWKTVHAEQQKKQSDLEDANQLLREQLQGEQLSLMQLQRQYDNLKADYDALTNAVPEELTKSQELLKEINELTADSGNKDENIHTPLVALSPSRRKLQQAGGFNFDGTQFISVYQKMAKVELNCQKFIENATGSPPQYKKSSDEANETKLVSGNPEVALSALSNKIDDLNELSNIINEVKIGGYTGGSNCRFVQFFSMGIAGKPAMKTESKANLQNLIRKLFNAKFLSDEWNIRGKLPLTPFPDFVLSYFYNEEGRMSYALHECSNLWKKLQEEEKNNQKILPETKLFIKFLKEELTTDELSFFLHIRYRLLGMLKLKDEENEIIKIPFGSCVELLDTILGTLSPVKEGVAKQAERLSDKGIIDICDFLTVFVDFYRNQRMQRREAIKIMITSKKFNNDVETSISLELFTSMMQALGFAGSIEDLLSLYKISILFGGGEITVDGVMRAMDSLAMHFYSIDVPVDVDKSMESTELARQMVTEHWMKFGQWFDGLRKSNEIDPWAKSIMVKAVRKVEQSFQQNMAAPTMFHTLRDLYDKMQFVLAILIRGVPRPLDKDTCDKQLKLLENLNTFLMDTAVEAKVA
ncbi:hypothetical protein TVAG_493280 [Trichomonas vaginalis G3]|uniref:Uncharacterized protein n=1 Tax=Trichomonas vaginalis (strain ATCC PRA-98 / G3) TaxID=412133 RepID=A2F2D6_TRIV3|nr:hypothetical protein TVAGG3_0233020 [Trichomonas vaginalis G3]EAY00955.1 hypothetical protein TVAG_493280 [Trichomonas vaginalis G3]KAI5552789.1 hypothetical protein TVAGG3_0233020 [Trichomonas vaginalis G3]|eukprot:XP_001330040.1 hypothetical protein [Trichomonas vaginalis G3]